MIDFWETTLNTSKFLSWLVFSQVEIYATILGFIYLVYSILGNRLMWIFGLITSAIYVYICYTSKIYADMGINSYYVVISIYGWFAWQNCSGNQSVGYKKVSKNLVFVLLIITLLLYTVIAFVLLKFTDSDVVYFDALTTSLSITATWMLARKIIEHWIVWIFVDALSVALYLYKGLYPTTVLFLVYTILAISGYITWNKKWKAENLQIN